ncbi:MAG: hypothetical protein JWQ13_3126 [Ramlibacter sp.]|jgi:hypothetical protein|nr:hypothetical protein [Ramlibacter sp.]
MRRRFFSLSLLALAAGCEPAPDESESETRDRLVGTWLRDYEEDGTHVRRILVLDADGRFREMSRSLGPEQAGATHAHEGEWLYDGTNLKRRYKLIDGKPVSAPTIPFLAFQIRFTGSHEFTGTDNVRRREFRYQRVTDGTLP